MSRRNKLEKFSDVLNFPNVVENYDYEKPTLYIKEGQSIDLKGQWQKDFFNQESNLTLELACGRGEYTLALGKEYPSRNFLGVDVKGARIWKGARIALEEGLNNVGFLRTRIELLYHFFQENEIDEIWITFPDPFLKKENRRLTAPYFLKMYHRILKPGGIIHLKTDDDTLYDFSLATISQDNRLELTYNSNDIYSKELYIPELSFKTYYEAIHLEKRKKIKYIQARLIE